MAGGERRAAGGAGEGARRAFGELEGDVLGVLWAADAPMTPAEIHAALGQDLAYTTVATLVRILSDKDFLTQTNDERPFRYRPARSYEDVSRKLLGETLQRVFQGSRELLLVRLLEQRKLTARERSLLEEILGKGGEAS